jgi:hypothetical protein
MHTGLGLMPLSASRSQFAFRFIDRAGISRQLTLDAHDVREALDVLLEAVPAIVDQIAHAPAAPAVRAPVARETAWQSGNDPYEGPNGGVGQSYVSPPPVSNGRY